MPHVDFIGADGTKYPSATELTSLLPQPWIMAWYKASVKKAGWRGWQKCLAQTKRGGTIGSMVHAQIESYIKKDKVLGIENKYGAYRFADALFDAVNPKVNNWIAIEPHLVSEALKIHGTADAVVMMDGVPTILDWKTSAAKSLTHPIQLAVYAMCWNEKKSDPIYRGVIARVDKKSKRLGVKLDVYDNLSQYYPIVKALRDIWEYSNAKED